MDGKISISPAFQQLLKRSQFCVGFYNLESPNLSFEKIIQSRPTAGSQGVENIMIGTEDEIDRDLRWAMSRPMSQATN